MSADQSTFPLRPGRRPTAARFRLLFDREPTGEELAMFRSAHQALALGVPARVRRGVARAVTRW